MVVFNEIVIYLWDYLIVDNFSLLEDDLPKIVKDFQWHYLFVLILGFLLMLHQIKIP